MTLKTECGLSREEVGASALKAYASADPGCVVADDVGLSILAQAAWLKLAASSEPILLKYEGADWAVVAQEVFECWSEGFGPAGCGYLWKDLPLIQALAWQAVARHLVWLFDLDEPLDAADLALAESRWGAWARLRLNGLSAQRSEA